MNRFNASMELHHASNSFASFIYTYDMNKVILVITSHGTRSSVSITIFCVPPRDTIGTDFGHELLRTYVNSL